MCEKTQEAIADIQPPSDLWKRVLDSLTAEVAVMDRSGRIIAVNQSWAAFAEENGGVASKTGVGANYLEVCRQANGEDSPTAQQACRGMEQVFGGQQEVFTLEYPCHSPNQERWFLLHASPLHSCRQYVVTTHLPITDRKLTEQRLLVAERLAAIGEAMQGLSHEGRNALQRARACMDLLRFHVANDSEALTLLDRMERAQDHLIGLYEEVKDYAAPITLSRQVCSLDQLVMQAWRSVTSPAQPVRLIHRRGEVPLGCSVDSDAIQHALKLVFDNVLATTVDATGSESDVSHRAGKEAEKIEVTYRESHLQGAAALTVIISDDGPGVPSEDLERVFDPFYTTRTRGTGLGLAVCRRIVAAHGGRIVLGNPQLGGASVYITLPKHPLPPRDPV